jgi:hypothetical protein
VTDPRRPEHENDRGGTGDRLLAALITVGLAAVLVRVSQLNFGAVLAPGLAVILLVAVLAVRRAIGPGQARSVLSLVAVGVLGLALLSSLVLVVLLVGLNSRGE